MAGESDYGAFTEKFIIQPSSSPDQELPLKGLTFAVKDIFDMVGYVTGFGNPDWARTHSAATTTAPAVLAVLSGGATCMGRTVMDEMAYSINGENKHYGTPKNICSPDRLPGGSSSGSAVAVGGMLVDFSLGTDTGGSVRVPAVANFTEFQMNEIEATGGSLEATEHEPGSLYLDAPQSIDVLMCGFCNPSMIVNSFP